MLHHNKIPKSLPNNLWVGIFLVIELALLSAMVAVGLFQPLARLMVETMSDLLAPPAPIAEVALPDTLPIPPTPVSTATATSAPTPTIINPNWIELPSPEGIWIGICVEEENGTLYLGGVTPNSITLDGLWKSESNGNSWEILQENPFDRFPDMTDGETHRTVKIGGEKVQMRLSGEYLSWVLQMTQDGENWISIQLPPVPGISPEDVSYDFAVINGEVKIWLAIGQVWQTNIKLP